MRQPSFVKCHRRLGVCRLIAGLTLCTSLAWTVFSAEPKLPEVDKDHAAKMAKGMEIFQKHVRPVLAQHCVKCHGGDELEGGLNLTDRDNLLKGGNSGPAIVAGKAAHSLLYKLVSRTKKPHMPYKADKLPDETLNHIAAWIDHGAPYDKPLIAGPKAADWTQKVIAAEARQFWSFQPLKRVDPPAVKNEAWVRTPIDRFILVKQEAAGIEPNSPASKQRLIRRAYFDLIGLPPTPEEVEAFLKDSNPDAFEKLVDRLLASVHYGERWGRHWLDLARFAESHGFEHDYDRPSAFHYRDFVIKALNDGMPFDQFVKWQIAGDESAPEDYEALKATGFLAAGVHSTQITKNEVEKHRYDEMDDMLATIGTSMLGLTIGCARCHDHKFDPIPQRDYYSLVSSFTTTVRSEIDIKPYSDEYLRAKKVFDKAHTPLVEASRQFEKEKLPGRLAEWEKSRPADAKIPPNIAMILKVKPEERTEAQKAELLKWYRGTDAEWKKLNQQVQEHLKKEPKPDRMLVSTEGLPAVRLHTQGEDFLKETHFLRRGDPAQKEAVATPSYLQVLMTASDREKRWHAEPPQGARTSYRRTALANWLTDVDHGAGHLLARVIVNRLWQHHLGRGIVATPSDFGNRGERPTHPELLDWLATELIKNGWRLKPIHKLIMTSAVYRQSSQFDEAKAKLDSENKLFWHRSVRRLEAEIIRDAMLAVSGELDPKRFGPGTLDPSSKLRSIYFTVKRSKLIPMMQVFDAPEALGGVAERPTSTIAPQALLLMNNPQVRSYAKAFAQRISAKASLEEVIQSGYLTAVARRPTAEELADSLAFVKQQMASYQESGNADARELALADFCQVLMCLNEFVYVD